MSDQVGNHEDRFSHNEAHFIMALPGLPYKYFRLYIKFHFTDPRATIERIAVDPTSGDIYYTGLIADAADASFIGVHRLDGTQSELISGLIQPRDIVLNTDLG